MMRTLSRYLFVDGDLSEAALVIIGAVAMAGLVVQLVLAS